MVFEKGQTTSANEPASQDKQEGFQTKLILLVGKDSHFYYNLFPRKLRPWLMRSSLAEVASR
jgi:hypothetical protein